MTVGDDKGPALPFGVKRVKELQDREFEVRDATGKAIVSDRLPKLAKSGRPGFAQTPNGGVLAGPAPYSLYIADDAGGMTLVGELKPFVDMFGNFRSGK